MKPGPKRTDPLPRFWDRVDRRSDDECWYWTAPLKPSGYGQFRLDGTNQTAQAAAYRLFIGPIPEGHQIDHTCHNADPGCPGGFGCVHRRCVNPAHLEAVSRSVNQLRAYARRRLVSA